MAFHFSKPEGFSHEAGQATDIFLINPPETDAEGNSRTFSIVSAPHEPDLVVATRMRDTAFKRVLKTVPIGTEVEIESPSGDFTLHNNVQKPAVFLAGGIGVTPFASISKDADFRKLPHQIYLFFSNRRPEDAPFLEQLQGLTATNPNYKLIPTMTDMANSEQQWDGETGYIDEAMLKRHIPDLTLPVYYIAGPPAMVVAMKDMLIKANVDSDNIRIEEFSGY